jgi:hypothetical protein
MVDFHGTNMNLQKQSSRREKNIRPILLAVSALFAGAAVR